MKIREITDKIEQFAPKELAESYDNVGLMVGSLNRECSGIVVALDLTMSVVDEAIANACNLIVTHHPFIFYAIKCVDTDTSKGELISKLLKHDITVYSAHTNLDECDDGLCMTLARKLGGENIEKMGGGGVLCDVKPTKLVDLAKHVARTLKDDSVKFVGDEDKIVKKAFVICGGGASNSAYDMAKHSADVFLTGDFKHNHYVDAENDDFPIVEFAHYCSEVFVTDLFEKVLADSGVKIIKAKQNCPFKVVGGQYEI